jgi:hypothetical protein
MINNMNKHAHDITILALLSTHAPLIYKHDPTFNPSFPIYQNLISQFTIFFLQLSISAKIGLFTSWVLYKSLKPNLIELWILIQSNATNLCPHPQSTCLHNMFYIPQQQIGYPKNTKKNL